MDEAMNSSSRSSVDDETGKASTTGASSRSAEEEQREKFTQKQTRRVLLLRVLVIIVLFLAAIAVSYVVYSITKTGQEEEFETQFEGAAEKVLEAFEDIVTDKLDAISSLAIAATAHGVDHGQPWPFVSVSAFQERASAARKQSKTLYTSVVPLVDLEERDAWENYTLHEDAWIQEGIQLQADWDVLKLGVSLPRFADEVHPGYILQDDYELGLIRDEGWGPYYPIWLSSPLLKGFVNFNLGSIPQWLIEIETSMEQDAIVVGRMLTPPPGDALHGGFLSRFFATTLSIQAGRNKHYQGDPFSFVFFPIHGTFGGKDESKPVAMLFAVIQWSSFFEDLLPPNIQGVNVIIENSCDEPASYSINGNAVEFLGKGDLHDTDYEHLAKSLSFTNLVQSGVEVDMSFHLFAEKCPYNIRVYPSKHFYNQYNTKTPTTITVAVAMVFVFTSFMFFLYDRLVERRQRILLKKAIQSSVILASLFPKNIRDRLMQDVEEKDNGKKVDFMAPNHRLKSFLTGDDNAKEEMSLQPIADLFPHATVFFADIAGFTAWSSSREPSQVFILLQTVYHSFDSLAKRRRVFKIETIGDSYVAVTGLPEPQENHALLMARFASDAMIRFKQVTRQLEVMLGPDTADLGLRIGLHSGPVTAGVLRGERSRFQLFGDTVNTAARMESSSKYNRVQISQKTADLLIAAGKEHWVKAREDTVNVKGKGVLNTFWLLGGSKEDVSGASEGSESHASSSDALTDTSGRGKSSSEINAAQQKRMVGWVVEVLQSYIRQILAKRAAAKQGKSIQITDDFVFTKERSNLEEIAKIITLPEFDKNAAASFVDPREIKINSKVTEQLQNYVAIIASTYRDNPFHNFQHACHVMMATNKFLQRIIAPDLDLHDIEKAKKDQGQFASQLHDYTHGINDPLTLFAIVFSALIHDVDHRGTSNAQLQREDPQMAEMYENKSIAEQNSLDIAWNLLSSHEFIDLRRCLFANEADFKHFRQVTVNVVLATDIFDKELNDLRKARWEKAFAERSAADDAGIDGKGLRATIVIEHIIQASDVAHTMQHWHVYRQWNQRLFYELTRAYRAGRMAADPATFWYQGEIGFFDNYIIPLAKMLKDCNVFGVSSDECLNYAIQNKMEWQERGRQIVEEMVQELQNHTFDEAAGYEQLRDELLATSQHSES